MCSFCSLIQDSAGVFCKGSAELTGLTRSAPEVPGEQDQDREKLQPADYHQCAEIQLQQWVEEGEIDDG